MIYAALTLAAYLSVGLWLNHNTASRGIRADTIFVILWGVYFIDEMIIGKNNEK